MAQPAESHPADPVSTELGERVRAIVAAAESMAGAMREDAEKYAQTRRREADEEAERRLREARERADRLVQERLLRMSELSDSVVAHAEAVLDRLGQADEVRRQLDQLVRAIGEAAQRVTDEVGSDNGEEHPMADQVRPLPPPDQPRPPLRPVQAPPAREHDEEQEEARLVALQMAVAGRSREAVAAHLREAFSIEDPEPILEQIFTGDLPGSAPPS